ncbi:homogentisate 1,2-dioxygenase-like isoform X2 [Aristolochia californica]|uniref:homogentisate 1,2-dioxygenase-like isoform X2 n=1 Tax=Aristolochia californica TaxID=171875 RepID=UPI0035DFBB26
MEESVRSDISDFDFSVDLRYELGFGIHFSSEALSGALPQCQNNPLVCPYGLYAEQISGTAFTVPRKLNQRSWFYHIQPSVTHEPFKPREQCGHLVSEFNQATSCATPTQLRWKPMEVPKRPTDFIDGLYTICGAGSSCLRHGFAIHMYNADKSMDNCAFRNADGDFLIVPHKGNGPSCSYIAEVFGSHFQLPDLGPIGYLDLLRASANGLAASRDFLVPTAWFAESPSRIYNCTEIWWLSCSQQIKIFHHSMWLLGMATMFLIRYWLWFRIRFF